MKKLQLIACVSCIAILLSSCSRQYHPELVGHYKPNTDVVKNQTSPSEELTRIVSSNTNQVSANTGETTPDLRLLQAEKLHQAISSLELNQKQANKLDKKIEKVKLKLEKATQSEKQIQHSDLSTTEQKHKVSLSPANDLLYVIVAIFIPPLAVALYEEGITGHFWLDLLLTLLFYVPGLIYALVIILGD